MGADVLGRGRLGPHWLRMMGKEVQSDDAGESGGGGAGRGRWELEFNVRLRTAAPKRTEPENISASPGSPPAPRGDPLPEQGRASPDSILLPRHRHHHPLISAPPPPSPASFLSLRRRRLRRRPASPSSSPPRKTTRRRLSPPARRTPGVVVSIARRCALLLRRFRSAHSNSHRPLGCVLWRLRAREAQVRGSGRGWAEGRGGRGYW